MQLSTLIQQYRPALKAKYHSQLLPSHHHAMQAMLRCRTPDAGEFLLHCNQCSQHLWCPQSCGHRSCPQCQNHETSRWLERQRLKLLPVEYFMLTFTLPYELRRLAWRHQTLIFNLLFACAVSTLKDFGLNAEDLGAEIGLTGVLHTHSRKLDFHPHVHFVVPSGGINSKRKQWIKKKNKYLFNAFALAKVFRARFLEALKENNLAIPFNLPDKWVADCQHVGKGEAALTYLSRYLYRGVISEKNIIKHQNGKVTFKYIDSKTGNAAYRTLKGEDFLWLVLQHVLPRGFRRIRDYGFLHGNAKKKLQQVQLILHVLIKASKAQARPVFNCPKCHAPMHIIGFKKPAWLSG